MTTLQKFQELAQINFVEHNGDIEIGTLNTADGYETYYVTSDIRNLQFDSEVYYYQPDFDTIMKAIDDLRYLSKPVSVECYDIEDYFDEYYMLDYISDNVDEDEFEKFTNTI